MTTTHRINVLILNIGTEHCEVSTDTLLSAFSQANLLWCLCSVKSLFELHFHFFPVLRSSSCHPKTMGLWQFLCAVCRMRCVCVCLYNEIKWDRDSPDTETSLYSSNRNVSENLTFRPDRHIAYERACMFLIRLDMALNFNCYVACLKFANGFEENGINCAS